MFRITSGCTTTRSWILPRAFATQVIVPDQLCKKMCILGGGQMCEAILGALSTKGIQPADRISVFDVNEKRLTYLDGKFGVKTSRCAQTAVTDADIVIVAVKPQNVQALAANVTIPPTGLLLSIVAGLTIDEIKKQFKTHNIIRSMPNTPAMIMEGITVWIHTLETPPDLVEKAKTLLNSFGDQIQVGEEQFLDMATAVSGSGPAVSSRAYLICFRKINFFSFFFSFFSNIIVRFLDHGSND